MSSIFLALYLMVVVAIAIASSSGSGKGWIQDVSNWLDPKRTVSKGNYKKSVAKKTSRTIRNQESELLSSSNARFMKETLSHTEMMKKMFQGIVSVLQQTPLTNRSLSIFDRELLEKLTNITAAQIEMMRRSEVVIHSEKLKRLYQNNPDLPEKTLVSIGRFLQELEELQQQEDQVQHMGTQEVLTVEVVRSATQLQQYNRSKQQREKWRQAMIAHEILEKAKSLK